MGKQPLIPPITIYNTVYEGPDDAIDSKPSVKQTENYVEKKEEHFAISTKKILMTEEDELHGLANLVQDFESYSRLF